MDDDKKKHLQKAFVEALQEQKDIDDEGNKGKPPYKLAIIDLLDAYHYADVFDDERYAWFGWQEYAKYTDYDMLVALADRLFWAFNPNAKTQAEWYKWDAGHDVRIYDADNCCLYKAHEKLPK